MLLGAVHKAAGIKAPIEIEAKSRYQARDIRRWAEYYGLPLEFPDPFPFRTLKTMRAAMYDGERLLEAFTREGFSLYWEEGGAPKGFSEAGEDGPGSEISRPIGEGPEAKQALTAATTEALERGVFGAPAFFVGGEMFWGNDRLHFVEEALRRD